MIPVTHMFMQLAADIAPPNTRIVRDAESVALGHASRLLVDHSYRVFAFGSLAGQASDVEFDPELLFVAALFHDLGLVDPFRSANRRFEVDGAEAAREFLVARDVFDGSVADVWDAIALHTTPGIPEFKTAVVALLTAGVEADVLGLGLDSLPADAVGEVTKTFPRTNFKSGIVAAFSEGIRHKPDTAFGNVKADVLAETLPGYVRPNFCDLIRKSPLAG